MTKHPNLFRSMRIIHLAMLGGLFLFLIMGGLLGVRLPSLLDESADRLLQVVVVVVSLASLILGFSRFKKKLTLARESPENGVGRMQLYMNACFTWWALIEGPGILAVIGHMLTGNYAFLALVCLHIIILFLFMPRKENIVVLLNLGPAEVQRLEGNGELPQ